MFLVPSFVVVVVLFFVRDKKIHQDISSKYLVTMHLHSYDIIPTLAKSLSSNNITIEFYKRMSFSAVRK